MLLIFFEVLLESFCATYSNYHFYFRCQEILYLGSKQVTGSIVLSIATKFEFEFEFEFVSIRK